MSALGDAMKAVRDVIVMQTRIDALHKALEDQAHEAKALARNVVEIDKRVSEIEGYLRAASRTAFGDKPRLPGSE